MPSASDRPAESHSSRHGWSVAPLSSAATPYGDPRALAVPRIGLLAALLAVVAVLFALRQLLDRIGLVAFPSAQTSTFDFVVCGLTLVVAIAMFVASRQTRMNPDRILDLASMFQVFGGLSIALLEQAQQHSTMRVSFACIWILSFTVLPVSLSRARWTAWLTALMGPVAMMIHVVLALRPPPSHAVEWVTFVPNALSAAIAVVIGRVIYGLGREVERERQLGAYRLVERIGAGGMGEVWRAEHHALIRPAAVKVMRRELTSSLAPGERSVINMRFQREVQATALLTSPHTVAVFDFGYTPDGTMYYAMELLTGLDAETLVKRYGAQPAERVVHILEQVCDSLAEAHYRNLVHRDIKPANLSLCALGLEVDFVKVLDFGLVRDAESSIQLTSEGTVSGTPAYLAPEASSDRVFDARSDLYGLGCAAYYLLTGQLVFEGATAAAVIAAHLRDEPVAPSKRTELPIPPGLDELVLSLLAKDPAARPQSADELRRRLRALPLEKRWDSDRAHAWWNIHVPELVERATAMCGPDSRETQPPARERQAPRMVARP